MSIEDEERAALIETGIKADQFKKSKIGQYLLNCAARDAHMALMKMKTVDPEDHKTIRDLQHDIKRHDDFERWLTDAILEGQAEYEQFVAEQED